MNLDKIKTFCCNSTYTRKAKLDYKCDECGKDVTVDIVLTHIMIDDDTRADRTED